MRELALQKRLGHASPESTRLYTQVSDPIEAEYLAFVERYYPNEGTRNFYRKNRALFVHTYPDLAEWFAAPLADRVGRRHGMAQGHYTHRASYEARQYLFYLAMRGYITLDWEWLIALPKIHLHHLLAETAWQQVSHNSSVKQNRWATIPLRPLRICGGRSVVSFSTQAFSPLNSSPRCSVPTWRRLSGNLASVLM